MKFESIHSSGRGIPKRLLILDKLLPARYFFLDLSNPFNWFAALIFSGKDQAYDKMKADDAFLKGILISVTRFRYLDVDSVSETTGT